MNTMALLARTVKNLQIHGVVGFSQIRSHTGDSFMQSWGYVYRGWVGGMGRLIRAS